MTPRGLEGLLVAGRAISATHVAMLSMRVQATCYALGQAAGIAASLAVEHDLGIRQIDKDELHHELECQDVRFHKEIIS